MEAVIEGLDEGSSIFDCLNSDTLKDLASKPRYMINLWIDLGNQLKLESEGYRINNL